MIRVVRDSPTVRFVEGNARLRRSLVRNYPTQFYDTSVVSVKHRSTPPFFLQIALISKSQYEGMKEN